MVGLFAWLTVVDQWSRQRPLLQCDFSLTGKRVVSAFEHGVPPSKLPQSLPVDHGTEFTSKALEAWAFYRGVQLDVTRPGKPTDTSHIKSFNGRLRDECLNVQQFPSLDHAKRVIEAWQQDDNERRPHSALGDLTPREFVIQHQETTTVNNARFLLRTVH